MGEHNNSSSGYDDYPYLGGVADEPEKRRAGIYGKATAIGAVALSVAATIAGNSQEGIDPPGAAKAMVESVKEGEAPDIDVSLKMQDIGVGGIKLPAVEFSVAEQPEAPVITVNGRKTEQDVHMRWAEEFAADPDARELSPTGEMRALRRQARQITSDGWKIESVLVQGYASMEDDHTAEDNPGFGIPSGKNKELAKVRSEAVAPRVERNIERITGRDIEVKILPGRENDDPKLAKDIEQVADGLGMTTVELVKTYNRNPQELPDNAVEVLNGLEDQRFVRVTIRASREKSVTPDSEKGNFVLIPLLIPIVGGFAFGRSKPAPQLPPRPVKFRNPLPRPQRVLMPRSHIEPVFYRRKQPRPYNFHFQDRAGRSSHVARDRGGSRRDTRVGKAA